VTRFPICCLAALALGLAIAPAHGGEPTFRGRTARQWLSRIQNEDGDYSAEVIATLAEMGPDAKVAVPVLIGALGSREEHVRDEAALALANIGPEARAAIPALIADYREPRPFAPLRGMQALALFGDAALAPLLEALEDPDEDVRGHAAQALGWMGEKAMPPLVMRLRHKKPEVRGAAAGALGQMGADAKVAVPALRNRLKDPVAEVCYRAVFALFAIDPKGEGVAARVVKTLVATKDYERLLFIADAINLDAGAKELVPTLIPLLDSENDLAFTVACKFLGRIGPGAEAAVPALEKQLRRGTKERASSAARTLPALGPKGRSAWRAALRHPDFDVAFEAAVGGLGEKGVDEALLLPAFLKGIKTKDPERQEMAAFGLAYLAIRSVRTSLPRGGDVIQAGGGGRIPRTGKDLARRATAALLDTLQHGKEASARLAAARYLGGQVRREAVVRALIGAMRDPDEDVRRQAVKALGGIGPPARAALPQLWKLVRTGESKEWRDEALRAVAMITRDWRKLVPFLLRLEREDESGERAGSILFAWELVAPRVEGVLVDLLQSREPDRRRLAFRILDHCFSRPSEQLVPALADVLSDKNVAMRCQAANNLGKIGPVARVAVPGLLAMLKAKDRAERAAAIDALARIGPRGKKACAVLIAALDEESLRESAVVALARMGPEARPAVPRLVAALEDEDPLVRCGAAWALGNIGPEAAPAVPALVMMLHSPHELLQASAARALGRIGPRARVAVPALRALSTDPRIAIRRRILGDVPGLSVTGRHPLSTLLPSDEPDAYAEAKKALAKIEPAPPKETSHP
jgi:HEAT repeat protein